MSDEQTNFKVTDRRLFNPDGTPREVSPEERPVATAPLESTAPAETTAPAAAAAKAETQTGSATAPASQPEAPPDASSQPTAAEDEELFDADDPAGFVNFVMSIASNAASSLGMMEHPVTHKREVDLELAKHWIDVLGMLEKKTRNNLLPQEDKILESLLADLRMQYVSLTSSAASNTRAFSGRDIVGG